MCGRYTLYSDKKTIETTFKAPFRDDFYQPRYNIAPGSVNPVVLTGKAREVGIAGLRWGLVPSWADDENVGYKMINARSETIDKKPSFSKPFQRKRCIIPVNGFYEWKTLTSGNKIPFYIRLLDEDLFGFAGLFDSWKSPSGEDLFTYTIITTEANALLQPLHERMPVILHPEEYEAWLDPLNSDTDLLKSMLRPFPTDRMSTMRVSNEVSKAGNEGPELIYPVL
jgi:putative SOS response-associated peptidase YedK